MAYSKQTWDTTSYVNPTRMNHIEDGIEQACSQRIEKGTYTATNAIFSGHNSGSGNYFSFFIPCKYDTTITSVTVGSSASLSIYAPSTVFTASDIDFSVQSMNKTPFGIQVELKYTSTKAANIPANIRFGASNITFA